LGEDCAVLTDEQIVAMTPAQRRELIKRLARPTDDIVPARRLMRRMREARVALIVGSVVVLVPWTVYLGVTLPRHYVVDHWDATWVGFDILLLLMLLFTAVLGFLRRQLLIAAAFATGVLLLCDAWFDVMTAHVGDLGGSLLSALLVELPLSVVLIGGSLQLMRLSAARLWVLEPGAHSWQIPLPLPSSADHAVRRRPRADRAPAR
jgi:hypothetical protein